MTESAIIIWKKRQDTDAPELGGPGDNESSNKESWTVVKILRGHLEDVYDLCWSPDSSSLISGSVDNTAIVWDVQKGNLELFLVVSLFSCCKLQVIFSIGKVGELKYCNYS